MQTDRHRDMQTDRDSYRQALGTINVQSDKQTQSYEDRQTQRYADRQT